MICSCWDHPRVCGEKFRIVGELGMEQGSPPRVRGKVSSKATLDNDIGITPACAGKRPPSATVPPPLQDHPRVCGEKDARGYTDSTRSGSPPRVRGKAEMLRDYHPSQRITPACAGKRQKWMPPGMRCRDHPRVCGEKPSSGKTLLATQGSPPRVRGKAGKSVAMRMNHRITPACAGKSIVMELAMTARWDHPRVCGEKTKESLKK